MAFSSLFAWSLRTFGWHGHGLVFFILAPTSASIDHITSHWDRQVPKSTSEAGLSLMQITCVLCLPSYIEPAREKPTREAGFGWIWQKHAAKSEIGLFGACFLIFLMFGGVCSTLSL